jgi:integrative and conjugative element protein (TIGR02256 family)
MAIYISKDALNFINNEVQISRNAETGGILLGAILRTEDILITHAIGPGPKAIEKHNEFQKDYDYSVKMLNILYRQYSVDFLGEWHKHPNNCIEYSSKDYSSMVKISRINTRPCFFIIVGNDFLNEENKYISIFSVVVKDKSIHKHDFHIADEPEKLAFEKGLHL